MTDQDKAISNGLGMTIYLAGPFFNEREVKTIRKLENSLEGMGFKVYSPSRDGKKLDMSNATPELREQVFKDNVQHLSRCELMVAVIDDRDPGTIWEMGARYGYWDNKYYSFKYAEKDIVPDDVFRKDVPAIVTYTDHNYGVNLMLAESVIAHCKGIDELEAYMSKFLVTDPENVERDRESTLRVDII